jgi:RNA methyltransferase, TrmH family
MITSSSNEKIKYIKSLARRHIRQQERAFIAEGLRLVEDALNAGSYPTLVLYNEALLARTERGLALLERIGSPEVYRRGGKSGLALTGSEAGTVDKAAPPPARILEVSDKLLAEVAETVTPQGILAVLPFLDWQEYDDRNPLFFVLDGLQDPGNLGTIMRSAEAAGATALLLSRTCVDVYNPKVVRAAMGAHFRLPFFADLDWNAIEAGLADAGISQVVAATMQAEAAIYDVDWRKPSAIIVGNEGRGLSDEALALATIHANIPIIGSAESLNAAVAASVIAFEAARQRRVLSAEC